ncbi:Daxx-like protein [Frankliniella fusca]|uniref:Death domain-associated protein 6 n=1 Tax=Frankliniella fusca TaxID=407009 RepID=A0AAE1HEZ2_9NEOP|nr:Daxx-like protein [Frankliniella fusca]
MVIKTWEDLLPVMDDSDIICLDSSQEEPPVVHRPQSAFSIAPPQLCQRWTQPIPQHSALHVNNVPTQWRQPQPVITSVTSLSPLKQKHNLRNFFRTSQPSNSSLNVGGFAWTPKSYSQNSLFNPVPQQHRLTPNLLVNSPVEQYSEIQIKEVKSLSPMKMSLRKEKVEFNSPVRKLRLNVVKALTKDKNNPECITLSDDEGDKGSNSDVISNQNVQKRETIKSDVSCELRGKSNSLADPSNEKEKSLDCNPRAYETLDSQSKVNAATAEEMIAHIAVKDTEMESTSTLTIPLKRKIKPIAVVEKSSDELLEEFLQACMKADSSEDMSTIINKKVKKHYSKVHSTFKKSNGFINLLKDLQSKVVQDPKNVYVHIADLTSELKARKDSAEEDATPPSKKKKSSHEKREVDYNEVESDRNVMKIRKLNKALTKVQKTIQQLETKEVDWDDDDDSSYIMLQRYKDRAVKIFNKICDITNESKAAGNNVKVHFSETPFPEVNKCIQQFVNETRQFPDFVDICEVMKDANEKNNLKLSDREIQDYAEKAFKSIGKELQRQRIHGHTESLLALIEGSIDPADTDKELHEELNKNKEHWKNINKVIDEFAEKAKKKNAENQMEEATEEDRNDEDDDDDDDDDDDEDEDEDEDEEDKNDDHDLSNLSSGSDGEESNTEDEENEDATNEDVTKADEEEEHPEKEGERNNDGKESEDLESKHENIDPMGIEKETSELL